MNRHQTRAIVRIREMILRGELRAGARVAEAPLAELLGMSRTPVREAFLRLEAEGLLRLYPQRGALVVPVSSEESRSVIEARLLLEQFATDKVVGRGAAVCAGSRHRYGRRSASPKRWAARPT